MKERVLSALLLISCLLGATGCVVRQKVMVHPDTGQQADCSSAGFGWLGAPVAYAATSDCISRMEALGYKEQDPGGSVYGAVFARTLANPQDEPAPVYVTGEVWKYVNPKSKEEIGFTCETTGEGYRGIWTTGLDESLSKEGSLLSAKDKDGKFTRYAPAYQMYAWPLSVGKAWNNATDMTTPTGQISLYTKFEVTGYGEISVPSGTFAAFHILETGRNNMRVSERWYSPQVRQNVRVKKYLAAGAVMLDLVSYPISAPLTPPSTSPPSLITTSGSNAADRLQQLKGLLDQGLIEKSEYERKKKEILEKL